MCANPSFIFSSLHSLGKLLKDLSLISTRDHHVPIVHARLRAEHKAGRVSPFISRSRRDPPRGDLKTGFYGGELSIVLHGCLPRSCSPSSLPSSRCPPPLPLPGRGQQGEVPVLGCAESSPGPTEMPAPGAQVQLSFNCFSALGSRCLWPVSTLCPRGSALCRAPPAASLSPQSLRVPPSPCSCQRGRGRRCVSADKGG